MVHYLIHPDVKNVNMGIDGFFRPGFGIQGGIVTIP